MRVVTRGLCVFLLGILAYLPVQAQQSKTIQETVALSATGKVTIDTYKGSITVTTWNRDEVEFTVRIEPDENEELVDLTEIEVDHSSRSLTLKTNYDRVKRERNRRDSWESYSLPFAHYTIKMPRTAGLTIDDYKSTIDITNLRADVSIDSYKGTIDVAGVQGRLVLDTYKGKAVIKDLNGSLRADTYKGEIQAELVDLTEDTDIETYRGEVELFLPERAGFDLKADMGRRGSLDTNLDRHELRRRDGVWRGSINGGGPALTFETYRGDFRLRVR